MSRGDETAFPSARPFPTRNGPPVIVPAGGLTIREHVIIEMGKAILIGAVTRGCPGNEWTDMNMAVKCADSLIAEMAKKVTP